MRLRLFLMPIIMLNLLCIGQVDAYESEDVLKVSIIAKLAKFVSGNDSAGVQSFTIAILNNPFGGLPDRLLTGKRIHNHPVIVQHIDSLKKLGDAQILFIPRMSPSKMQDVLLAMNKKHILTISDSRGFAQLGGMIQMYTASRRLKLKINLDVARQAGLRIRSSLLKIAEIVKEEK
ncbi:MAG: YfiR family protein [Mariprofundaceae bacterium]|nr:YfiR family protein [Mariprofundaceae bacterium]